MSGDVSNKKVDSSKRVTERGVMFELKDVSDGKNKKAPVQAQGYWVVG